MYSIVESNAMPVFDTPINANAQNWQKVIGQRLPVLLYLYNRPDAQLDEALKHTAREHVNQLLVVRVDANENQQVANQYNASTLPALITIKDGSAQSTAAPAQPTDIDPHTAYILNKGPKPVTKAATNSAKNSSDASATGMPVAVTDASFTKDVLQSNVPVLVDFWAPWCGPCHMVAPIVEKIAKKYQGRVKVVKLNVDENPQTAGQYQTMSIPTLILFKNKQVAGRLVGAHPQGNIEQMIEKAL
jgi:thioredoxin 1